MILSRIMMATAAVSIFSAPLTRKTHRRKVLENGGLAVAEVLRFRPIIAGMMITPFPPCLLRKIAENEFGNLGDTSTLLSQRSSMIW